MQRSVSEECGSGRCDPTDEVQEYARPVDSLESVMPKPYTRPMPAGWWLRKRAYFWFMMRELTAVFVAAYCVMLLYMLWKVKSGGGVAYDDLLTCLQTSMWS